MNFVVRKFSVKVIASVTILALLPLLSANYIAQAAVTSDYYIANQIYNNIISNRDFTDVNSMTQDEIQQFLVAKGSPLKDFSENGRTAAQIIFDAAHGKKFTSPPYDTFLGETFKEVYVGESTGTVSPRVILVTLQKEQSLITENRTESIYKAMGYGCPDGSSCSPNYAGFTMQIEWGAWQLRYNYERAQGKGADFQVGQTMNNVDGAYNVTFMNAATASLYRYTPHVFNGNFNFYNLYNDWFTAHIDTVANDTTNFTLKTYSTNQSVSGSKGADIYAYLNGTFINGAGLGTTSWSVNLPNLAVGTNNYSIEYRDTNGTLVGTKLITIAIYKPGDINGDNSVDVQDLSIFATYWNNINPEEPLANLTGEVGHAIDVQDLSILAGYWGR